MSKNKTANQYDPTVSIYVGTCTCNMGAIHPPCTQITPFLVNMYNHDITKTQ